MTDKKSPPKAPTNEEIIDAINALTAQEKALRDAVNNRDDAVSALLEERESLQNRLEEIRTQLNEPQQLLLQAQHEMEVNAALLANRRDALSRLFSGMPLPVGFEQLLEPLQLITTPAPVVTTTPTVLRSYNAEPASKKLRTFSSNGATKNESDFEDLPTGQSTGSKRKRPARISRAAAEATELTDKYNEPGLLDWVFKSNAPAYLKGSESVIWVRSPFTLGDDDVNKHVGKFYAIRCPLCDGNSSVGKNGEFMCGLDGLWLHVTRQHKDSEWAKKKAMNVFDSIPKTELSSADVLQIRKKAHYVASKPAESGSRPVDEFGRRIKKEPLRKRVRKTAPAEGTTNEAQTDNSAAVTALLAAAATSQEVNNNTPAREQSPIREASPIVMDDPEEEARQQEFNRFIYRRPGQDDHIVTSPGASDLDDEADLPPSGSFPPVARHRAFYPVQPQVVPTTERAVRSTPAAVVAEPARRRSSRATGAHQTSFAEKDSADEGEDDESVDEVEA